MRAIQIFYFADLGKYESSERDESTEEQLQCKKQCLCSDHGALSPALAMSHGHARAQNPCQSMPIHECFEPLPETIETNNAIKRYTKINPESLWSGAQPYPPRF